MFIGRKSELDSLNKLYIEDKFQFIVMYGRRRVGKTTLLAEFCKDKPSIFLLLKNIMIKWLWKIFQIRYYHILALTD
ncbi:ATP-binding protein [Caloramator sp. Dgby_cultured_2]|uniref:ATP-binding protein n=1 Tax=Caloramator sp. Dgby_cultured_2 TaxID=3029174 RepID=UPI00237DAE31|nr:ATP-binding protein [Caloramator sp. Dgby_cultured_2]WDU83041.1 hypothetical protein PWK10_16760 [Caloramator sp. Dgby_cultured_2]